MPAALTSGPAPRLLLLWDLDHTLIETRGVGRTIYERAFPAATGQPLTTLTSISGRTELDIMAESLRLNNIAPTDEMIKRLARALVRGYQDARDELRTAGRALPGVQDTLANLAHNPTVYQSVLTGNLRNVARIKLEVFNLDHYLDLNAGAYGDDDPERPKLVTIAQQRAAEQTGVARRRRAGTADRAQPAVTGRAGRADRPSNPRRSEHHDWHGSRSGYLWTGRRCSGRGSGPPSTTSEGGCCELR
jgi:phosphoglycolate phosphatase